jgi:adenylate cyclase
VFDLQDRVTAAVAGAIEPSVTQAEIRRAYAKPTENLLAYDWLLRARGEQQLFSRDGFDRAMRMARRAIELDPRYAQAYSGLVGWIAFRRSLDWMQDEEAESVEGVRLAHLAVRLAPNDALVLTDAAVGVGILGRDLATAISWLDRAIALNPNSAQAFGRGAMMRLHAGDYAAAIDHADRAMRLSPFDSYSFLFSLARGIGRFYQRQLPEAVAWLGKAAQQNPAHSPTYLFLGSALAHAGRMEEARAAIRRLLELHPADSVTWRRQRRFRSGTEFEYVVEGARLAGLPE